MRQGRRVRIRAHAWPWSALGPGAQIAYQAALHGYQATLCGRDMGPVDRAAVEVLQRRGGNGKLDAGDLEATSDPVELTCDVSTIADADIIIESVAEDRATKREVLPGAHARDSAIIGMNSSTLPSSFAEAVPALRGCPTSISTTRPWACSSSRSSEARTHRRRRRRCRGRVRKAHRQAASGGAEGKLRVPRPMACSSSPCARRSYGWNGYTSIEDCDEAARGGLGWPIGPFALADLIGLDVTAAILNEAATETGESPLGATADSRRACGARRPR